MLTRICTSCGRRVIQGKMCVCQRARHGEYDRTHRDKAKAALYSSADWKRLASFARQRAGYKDEYLAMYQGRLEPGSVIHHIRPLEDDMGAAYDTENLVCVSQRTHRMIHDAYSESVERKREMQKLLLAIRGGGG